MQFPITIFNFRSKINTNFQNFELENHHSQNHNRENQKYS